jgi:DNA-binding NarL/FixJ family response regulator
MWQHNPFYNNRIKREKLSDSEKVTLCYVAVGLSDNTIAYHLNVKAKTVNTHLQNIYKKLDISCDTTLNQRVSAVTIAKRLKIITEEEIEKLINKLHDKEHKE